MHGAIDCEPLIRHGCGAADLPSSGETCESPGARYVTTIAPRPPQGGPRPSALRAATPSPRIVGRHRHRRGAACNTTQLWQACARRWSHASRHDALCSGVVGRVAGVCGRSFDIMCSVVPPPGAATRARARICQQQFGAGACAARRTWATRCRRSTASAVVAALAGAP